MMKLTFAPLTSTRIRREPALAAAAVLFELVLLPRMPTLLVAPVANCLTDKPALLVAARVFAEISAAAASLRAAVADEGRTTFSSPLTPLTAALTDEVEVLPARLARTCNFSHETTLASFGCIEMNAHLSGLKGRHDARQWLLQAPRAAGCVC